jgi:hypothetical protein
MMSDLLRSRSVAEHLCTLASLLEAEAMKAGVLGMQVEKSLHAEARKVRTLAEQLWEIDCVIDVSAATGAANASAGGHEKRRRGGQMKLVSA